MPLWRGEDKGLALADTDAEGAEGELAAAALQLARAGHHEAGPRHAERMTKRNGATVRVHVRGVVG
jgi:hypothetical protein